MDIEFSPPGPGHWALDRSHYPGGTTPISQWLISESMSAGMERVFAEIGAPVKAVDARFVNGFMYTRVRPLIGADKPAKRLPPTLILKIATRLHPEFRRRAKQATITLNDRPHLAVAKRWDAEIRPRLTAENRGFQHVELTTLDDPQLQQHITELLAHLRQNYELHFWLHGHDIGPIARLLYECIGWGIEPDTAIHALAGASPSTSRPAEALRRIKTIVEASSSEPRTLDDVRAVSNEAAGLLDAYLEDHGEVLATGYDITALRLVEMPGVILSSIRSASETEEIDHEAIAADLRASVPADQRPMFDQVLGDARAVMDMRDDNGPLTVEWPLGLLRRAMLEAGTRLADRHLVTDLDHVFEVTHEEARSLLVGGLPAASELAERAELRTRRAALTPPASLGPVEPEPPLDVLPDPLPKLVAMVQLSMTHLGMDGAIDDSLDGVGIGTEIYTGRARTAASAEEAIERMEPGDVLVVRATSPAFNAVLMIAGAIVTADGGAMSHAAVLARELGVPAIVGAGGALSIVDGSTVEVDPTAGTVRVIG